VFQFTRPAWGATPDAETLRARLEFQFTRPAWGATQDTPSACYEDWVSIHAPRVGRDTKSILAL